MKNIRVTNAQYAAILNHCQASSITLKQFMGISVPVAITYFESIDTLVAPQPEEVPLRAQSVPVSADTWGKEEIAEYNEKEAAYSIEYNIGKAARKAERDAAKALKADTPKRKYCIFEHTYTALSGNKAMESAVIEDYLWNEPETDGLHFNWLYLLRSSDHTLSVRAFTTNEPVGDALDWYDLYLTPPDEITREAIDALIAYGIVNEDEARLHKICEERLALFQQYVADGTTYSLLEATINPIYSKK
jgi:hypothetical protein